MGKCRACGREMLKAKGCVKVMAAIRHKGFVDPIPVGGPGDHYEGSPKGTRCGDCGAMVGYYHHPGCDMEVCPECGGQRFDEHEYYVDVSQSEEEIGTRILALKELLDDAENDELTHFERFRIEEEIAEYSDLLRDKRSNIF